MRIAVCDDERDYAESIADMVESVQESTGHMADIENELLKYPAFIKPHRSYIVNMAHIDS